MTCIDSWELLLCNCAATIWKGDRGTSRWHMKLMHNFCLGGITLHHPTSIIWNAVQYAQKINVWFNSSQTAMHTPNLFMYLGSWSQWQVCEWGLSRWAPSRSRSINAVSTATFNFLPNNLKLVKSFPKTPDPDAIQIGGAYATSNQEQGILSQTYRDTNGSCIVIPFKSIPVRGCVNPWKRGRRTWATAVRKGFKILLSSEFRQAPKREEVQFRTLRPQRFVLQSSSLDSSSRSAMNPPHHHPPPQQKRSRFTSRPRTGL